jgi:hypothetical membrane protein
MKREARAIPSFLGRTYPFLGMVGTVLTCAVMVAAALAYSGKQGEPYSPLNHFISELGEAGVSRGAWLFNAGLVAAGALFVPFCIALGLQLASLWSYLGLAAGVCAGVFLAGVGVFPMNRLPPHVFTAMWFFRSGLATVLLFGIAFAAQRRDQRRVRMAAVPISAVAGAAYAAFLFRAAPPTLGRASSLDTSHFTARPGLWPAAVMEWVVFLSTILWFLGVSLTVRRAPPRSSQEDQGAGGA